MRSRGQGWLTGKCGRKVRGYSRLTWSRQVKGQRSNLGGRGALNREVEGFPWERQRQESKVVKVWGTASERQISVRMRRQVWLTGGHDDWKAGSNLWLRRMRAQAQLSERQTHGKVEAT
jgi:hypothetical protein